jgi:uncharacterized ParB-like nuclease family protein
VLHVADGGDDYYFSFGGCHRWAATQRLGLPTIRAWLIPAPPSALAVFLGASHPLVVRLTTNAAARAAAAAKETQAA